MTGKTFVGAEKLMQIGNGVNLVICQKSKGHTSPQCRDTDEDVYFIPDYKPNAKKKKG